VLLASDYQPFVALGTPGIFVSFHGTMERELRTKKL
jgi:hypothetical protein